MNKKTYCESCNEWVDYLVKYEERTEQVKEMSLTMTVRTPHCLHCDQPVFVEEIESEAQKVFFDAYRSSQGLPTVEEIIDQRKRLGLNQRDFSRLLGFGEITISRYELGSLPTRSNAMIIQNIMAIENLKQYYQNHQSLISMDGKQKIESFIKRYSEPSLTGNRHYHVEKFHQLTRKFVEWSHEIGMKMYPTKLNKLMFYADFNGFRLLSKSITGSKYLRMTYGPVPNQFDFKYDQNPLIQFVFNEDSTVILPNDVSFDCILSTEEINISKAVFSYFKNHSSVSASLISHEEDAWKEVKTQEYIPYDYALRLKINV